MKKRERMRSAPAGMGRGAAGLRRTVRKAPYPFRAVPCIDFFREDFILDGWYEPENYGLPPRNPWHAKRQYPGDTERERWPQAPRPPLRLNKKDPQQ